MKKQLLFFALAMGSISAIAQSIPNGNFESWTSATYEYPQYYPENSNREAYFQCQIPFNVTKSTDAYAGSFALRMETGAMAPDTCFGFIANPDNSSGSGGPSSWTGGMPISEKPLGIRGYYKYNIASGDSAGILIVARQGGTNIGTYLYTLGGIHTSYTLFNFTFSPALPVTPDSIIFAAVSSNPFAGVAIPGSVVLLDSLSFTGISTQPSQFNGDFELWQTQLLESPDMWYNGNDRGNGVAKTTDRVAGDFALELETYLGDNNGMPRASAGYLSTGYWDNACWCQRGGYPFSNMVDTLVFSYKYLPADPTDSANVNLSFKNAGATFAYAGTRLFSTASYQVKEIPINLGMMPDSLIISIQSSDWADTTLNFVGAILRIDEMHFKSQPLSTGISMAQFGNEVHFYPNPFKTTGTIQLSPEINTAAGIKVNIYDVTGRVVKTMETTEHRILIDRSGLQNGIYFYDVRTDEKSIKIGKIIIE